MSDRPQGMRSFLLIAWALFFVGLGSQESRPLALALHLVLEIGPDLLVAAGTLLSLWALGAPVRRRLVPNFGSNDRATCALLDVGLGLSVGVAATSVLGSLGVMTPFVCRALFLCGLLLAVIRAKSDRTVTDIVDMSGRTWPLILVAGGLFFPSLFELAAPMLGPDESQYHRRFIEILSRTGAVPGDSEDAVSGFALGLHCIAAVPSSITGVGAARALSFLLGILGLFAGERLLRRCFGPGHAWTYVFVVTSSVTLLRVAPSLNTDLSTALLVVLIALISLDWAQAPASPEGRPWVLALLGGAALSIKFSIPLFIAPFYVIVAVAILWDERVRDRGRLLLILTAAALLPALFGLPWFIKNQLILGHPLYPIFGLEIPPEAPTAFAFNFNFNYGPGSGIAALLRTPWDLFITGREFDGRHFMGRFGVWPLIAVPGVLWAARTSRAVFLLALASALGFVLWSSILLRAVYLLPLWPVLAALTAGALGALLPSQPGPARSCAVFVLGTTLVFSTVAELAPAWEDQLDSAVLATGQEQTELYLQRKMPIWDSLQWVREHSRPEEGVAQFWCWGFWDLPNPLVWAGAESFTPLRARLLTLGSSPAVLTELRQLNVRWVIYRDPILLQPSFPTVSEADWQLGFAKTMAISEELVRDHLTLRHEQSGFSIYEVPPLD